MSSGQDGLLERVVGLISKTRREELERYIHKHKLPLSSLVAIAIEHELERDRPFSYDTSQPPGEYKAGLYLEEAIKIAAYLTQTSGMSLTMLTLNRHDIGIPDREKFMFGFIECLLSGKIESYNPKQSLLSKFKYDDDYMFYRIAGSGRKAAKKVSRQARDYEKYQQLKRKFKDE